MTAKTTHKSINEKKQQKIHFALAVFFLTAISTALFLFQALLAIVSKVPRDKILTSMFGTFSGILCIVAIVSLPIYTIVLLKLGNKIKKTIGKIALSLLPSAFLMTSMVMIDGIELLSLGVYLLLASYPSILLITHYIEDLFDAEIRWVINIIPTVLATCGLIYGVFASLVILSC